MICGELITWMEYQGVIIFEILCENSMVEIFSYKYLIFNFEHINGGEYVLFDTSTKKVFII
ncbi:hypothetical protein BK709_01055 [Bacillus thuringiensis serovar shandongiensis]|nr:hypothetical protein BK717_22955 [Bacillus thuringiensis serovar malayensis]OUB11460.1 hypothetical protein BK709_01055 [Bacillus thuringiensis serovar shandongiensis]